MLSPTARVASLRVNARWERIATRWLAMRGTACGGYSVAGAYCVGPAICLSIKDYRRISMNDVGVQRRRAIQTALCGRVTCWTSGSDVVEAA